MINKYFQSSILILIDEMNMLLQPMENEERIDFTRNKFSEADLAIRLGAPFRHLARFPMQGTQGKDILIDYKDLEVEVKYWRYWIGGTGKQKRGWSEAYSSAFSWLYDEINQGKKGKRAIICGWFAYFEWRNLLSLGKGPGPNPIIDRSKLNILPFLSINDGRVGAVETNYSMNIGEKKYDDVLINWELYGHSDDMMNIVILY